MNKQDVLKYIKENNLPFSSILDKGEVSFFKMGEPDEFKGRIIDEVELGIILKPDVSPLAINEVEFTLQYDRETKELQYIFFSSNQTNDVDYLIFNEDYTEEDIKDVYSNIKKDILNPEGYVPPNREMAGNDSISAYCYFNINNPYNNIQITNYNLYTMESQESKDLLVAIVDKFIESSKEAISSDFDISKKLYFQLENIENKIEDSINEFFKNTYQPKKVEILK